MALDKGLEGRQRQAGACQIVLDALPHQGASQGGLALGNLLQAEPVTGQYVTVGILWMVLTGRLSRSKMTAVRTKVASLSAGLKR